MDIKIFNVGSLGVNCYLLSDNNIGYIFDCGGEDVEKIVDYVNTNKININYIILTHGHGDHIEGLHKIKAIYPNADIYIGKEEKDFLLRGELNLMSFINGKNFSYTGDVKTVSESDKIGEFLVLDTPGHTIGSKCFYNEKNKILISGDTIFRRSYGRYDLATGDKEALFNSLKKLCAILPEDTKVYSGHTGVTTIKEEKDFLKFEGII